MGVKIFQSLLTFAITVKSCFAGEERKIRISFKVANIILTIWTFERNAGEQKFFRIGFSAPSGPEDSPVRGYIRVPKDVFFYVVFQEVFIEKKFNIHR